MYGQAHPVRTQSADMNQTAIMSQTRHVLAKRASDSIEWRLKKPTGKWLGLPGRSSRHRQMLPSG